MCLNNRKIFRLTYFIEMLKDREWTYHVGWDNQKRRDYTYYPDSQHISLSRNELQSYSQVQ